MKQTFGTTTVRILRTRTGERFAEIQPKGRPAYHVPTDLLSLAAGKDAWMRDIRVPCACCGESSYRAGDLESGLCPVCLQEAEEENARLDRGEA